MKVGATFGARNGEFPGPAEQAALRAWFEGFPARSVVVRYLGTKKVTGQSSRAMLSAIRRRLAQDARAKMRPDLAEIFETAWVNRTALASEAAAAIVTLESLTLPTPQLEDAVNVWLSARQANALVAAGLGTLATLTVGIPRRRRWWAAIPGLGTLGARQIEAFFAEHSSLTELSRDLLVVAPTDTAPWERLLVPQRYDGSEGMYRAPKNTCTLSADNDYQAIHAWLDLQESSATARAYRKEAERLMLWAILERGKAMSSLTTEDAIAYRAFLRRPSPRERWVGAARPRASSEWRPFQGALSARSVAYALTVVGAMYRWLIEQRYLLANPFAGVKVKGGRRAAAFDGGRAFNDHEWALIRFSADDVEWSGGWTPVGAHRLRFVLDFWYATGLRPSEMAAATLGSIERDDAGDDWLNVVGKGSKEGKVSLPLMATGALDRYLVQRGLPVTRSKWRPDTPLVPHLDEIAGGLSSSRVWAVMTRFFEHAASTLEVINPGLAKKLRKASPHWMRHTHASHALANGADLTTVRDNLRHASIATTSVYLHADQATRARQMREAFKA